MMRRIVQAGSLAALISVSSAGYAEDAGITECSTAKTYAGSRDRSILSKSTPRGPVYAAFMDDFYRAVDELVKKIPPKTIGAVLDMTQKAFSHAARKNNAALQEIESRAALVIDDSGTADDREVVIDSATKRPASAMKKVQDILAVTGRDGGYDISVRFMRAGHENGNWILGTVTPFMKGGVKTGDPAERFQPSSSGMPGYMPGLQHFLMKCPQ